MDFTTIKKHIESNEITTPKELHDLYALTFQNSITFNNKKTDVYKDTVTVDNFHVRELHKAFPTHVQFITPRTSQGGRRPQGRPKSSTPKPSPRSKGGRKASAAAAAAAASTAMDTSSDSPATPTVKKSHKKRQPVAEKAPERRKSRPRKQR